MRETLAPLANGCSRRKPDRSIVIEILAVPQKDTTLKEALKAIFTNQPLEVAQAHTGTFISNAYTLRGTMGFFDRIPLEVWLQPPSAACRPLRRGWRQAALRGPSRNGQVWGFGV